uniref:Uncharacterized protein n=1 Tax=Brassica oleracea var. oleracea TaxID=109376 RepID=A0A0D3CWJ5_BRAOL
MDDVVEKNKEIEAIRRVDALQKVLKEVHYLFVMFHGSARSLLDKETSGGLIISHLYPFITDYLNGKAQQYHHPISLLCHVSDLSVGKKLQLPSFRETLKECGTVQMLTSLEVQVCLSLRQKMQNRLTVVHCFDLYFFLTCVK